MQLHDNSNVCMHVYSQLANNPYPICMHEEYKIAIKQFITEMKQLYICGHNMQLIKVIATCDLATQNATIHISYQEKSVAKFC